MIKRSGQLVFTLLCGCFFTAFSADSQTLTDAIRLNQIGFYPKSPKVAIVTGEVTGTFYLTTPDLKKRVFTGQLSAARTSSISGKTTCSADFSAFRKKGKYVLVVPSLGHSYPFDIRPQVHNELAVAALKSFYYQRASTPLPEMYAGRWQRGAGHPDRQVLVHASAADTKRPTGTVIHSPGGWYDAGDYNKYIVNSGITMGTLMALYEDFPKQCSKIRLNIPESNNKIPDLLDEVLWNLRWMLTMQDPNDGGVYHKCTTAEFEGFIRPEAATDTRYVVQKTTAAALDFAAVMAQASRIFKSFERELPGLADTCLLAARNAWGWAGQYPNRLYDQGKMNQMYNPDINTGAYGDSKLADERVWAAVELYITTREPGFLDKLQLIPESGLSIPTWNDVRMMGIYSILRHKNTLDNVGAIRVKEVERLFKAFSELQTAGIDRQAYLAPMEQNAGNFVWGSMAVCANQGIALVYQYRQSGERHYLDQAQADLDYILGRNATGYSFVTGYGSKTPMHPHHRPSETDDVPEPVPGLLAGGPNPGQQDKCPDYPSSLPDESYVDAVCSYASNEIAINWNAPLVYLTFALEFLNQD